MQGSSPPNRPLSLVEDFQRVLARADGQAITIGQTLDVLADRGPAMVILLLTMLCLIPGLASTVQIPVGVAVALFGLQIASGLRPWLPKFVARRSLSFNVVSRLIGVAVSSGRPIEKLLRPRLAFMLHPITHVVIGATLVLMGIILGVPLFIPFSNELPAAVIAILLLGLIERDGVFIIVGEILSLAICAACGYVIYLLCRYGFDEGVHMVRQALHLRSTTRPN